MLNQHGRSSCTLSGWWAGCFYFRRARRHPKTQELRRTLQRGSIRGPRLNRLSRCETWPLLCRRGGLLDVAGSCRFRTLCVDRQSAALRSQITGTDRDNFDASSVVCRGIQFIFCVLWLTNMRVGTRISALRQTKWHEYLFRFFIGGAATALAGLVAMRFGAGIGGLFLAFPVIFPASATLIYSHEKKKKSRLWDVRSGARPGAGRSRCLWCDAGCDWTYRLRSHCLMADFRAFNVFNPGCSDHSLAGCFPDALVLSRVSLQTRSQPIFNCISQRHMSETTIHRRSH